MKDSGLHSWTHKQLKYGKENYVKKSIPVPKAVKS